MSFSFLFLTLSILSSFPIKAAIKQQNRSLPKITKRLYLALSWGDIFNVFRRRKTPGGSRGEICAILPQELENLDNGQKGTDEIWTDKPIFYWRGVGATQIDIKNSKGEIFATLKVKDGLTKIKYDSKPLQLGEYYRWQITAEKVRGFPTKESVSYFKVMDSEKRDGITKNLKQLEATLKKEGATVEKIALGKADYFAKKEMWTDVLEQLYSVQNPSPQLVDTIKNIEGHNFCNSKQAVVSTLP
ncbi:DUF928 domain-containing protein [Plectonema cf. radiosum LEGE 06105]|uniref:DUF928 domain-containing protein n=1 Tax=Plectonema cf. radiosum LEGE 06105 TaxID=945769 RepID=A0A8J7EZF1_9CYAN|nr:DUF928 domain-containing protein [Plectonema radiosum]MBE9213006.1 DUF928 domain-containing protein [Plectonema cf. radiosum LEGE 06105]